MLCCIVCCCCCHTQISTKIVRIGSVSQGEAIHHINTTCTRDKLMEGWMINIPCACFMSCPCSCTYPCTCSSTPQLNKCFSPISSSCVNGSIWMAKTGMYVRGDSVCIREHGMGSRCSYRADVMCDVHLIHEHAHVFSQWSPHLSIRNAAELDTVFDTYNIRVGAHRIRRTMRYRGNEQDTPTYKQGNTTTTTTTDTMHLLIVACWFAVPCVNTALC